ncbi:unnamed protein product [Prorocentrum cordatum]|uniref:Major facilitator superfamily associated domain-containing protein n=1 Tax=Prorocentrum cordatum TaxID=2364126 RepID=A0ABN9WR29_9DINO|nr:unnamed protein product [Polarella glacialis]
MAAVPAAECQFEAPPRLTPVGFMQLCVPWITFLSSLGWAALCDRLGEYKRVLVVSNSVGAAAICCLLLGPVHTHFAGVCACMFAGSAFLASRTGVVDALTLRVVRDYEEARAQGRSEAAGGELPSYGPQRLWGAAGYGIFGLLSGVGADAFGDGAMFVLFGACLATTVLRNRTDQMRRGTIPLSLSRFPPLGLLGGPRRHRWICLEILVRTRSGRGPGSSSIGTLWFPHYMYIYIYTDTLQLIGPALQGRAAVHKSPLRASDLIHRPPSLKAGGTCEARPRVSEHIFPWRRF